MNPSLLMIIPARGGSKGLPRKNIKCLDDVPLIAWTYDAVQRANLPNARCLLSTEDKEIAEVGRALGLEVPFLRPPSLAQDHTSAVDVALHALDWLQSNQHYQPQFCMLLQPTSPFRPPDVISQAVQQLYEQPVDAVIGVKSIYRSLQTLFRQDAHSNLTPLASHDAGIDIGSDRRIVTRRQEIEPCVTPNGAMYLIKTPALYRDKVFFPDASIGLAMDAICSHDIDTPLDWDIAQAYVAANLTWREAGR